MTRVEALFAGCIYGLIRGAGVCAAGFAIIAAFWLDKHPIEPDGLLALLYVFLCGGMGAVIGGTTGALAGVTLAKKTVGGCIGLGVGCLCYWIFFSTYHISYSILCPFIAAGVVSGMLPERVKASRVISLWL